MGIDVCIYRSRVGLFSSCRSAGVKMTPFITDISQVVKMIGAVTFIRVLLVMAGVEQNPGPGNQKFVFRYQYLLIEVGTEVMQALFDDVIGTDFGAYLAANVTAANRLQWLIGSGKITDAQQNYLPPIDTKPLTSNFDITLLSCLLRNVCGLRRFYHAVWKNPAPTDHSLEADVTRLRECRNHVSHMHTVFISATDVAAKWTELTEILKRLNSCHKNGVIDLPSKINQAEQMDIDDIPRKRYSTIVDQWRQMDRLYDLGIRELTDKFNEFEQGLNRLENASNIMQQGQSKMQQALFNTIIVQSKFKQDLLAIKQGQSQLQKDVQKDREKQEKKQQEIRDTQQAAKLENEIDLKNRLMKMYQKDCSTLPVLPLCDNDEDEVDLLSIYQPPSLSHVPYHRTEEKEEQYPISYYHELFSKADHCFRNIFITGDAGVGKSSFCKCVSLLWYKSQCNEKVDDKDTQKNIEFMEKFDFTFFVSLRDTDRSDVITMIIEQVYTETEFDLKMNELYQLVENTLKKHVCLVMLDGLDEWTPKPTRIKDIVLPHKITADKCSFIITCRPYKIENVRLSRKDLDRQVQMRGICGESTQRYVTKIVARSNKANSENKNPKHFVREIKKCGLYHQLSIPIIGSHLVALWFDCKLTDMSRALIYSKIVEMLFERAEKRNIHLPSAPLCNIQLPDSLTGLIYFQNHFAVLAKICLLSFRSLFELDECVSVLVYTRKQLMSKPYFFSYAEMDFLCKIGILSRNKVIGRFGKQEQKLSYLHKSYLEYFAALFVSSFDNSNAFDDVVKEWTTVNNIVQFQTFFIFLSGFLCENVKVLFEEIYLRISEDLISCRRNAIFHSEKDAYKKQIKSLQTIVINCFNQFCKSSNPKFAFRLEDFIFDYEDDFENDSDYFVDISDCDSIDSSSDDDEFCSEANSKFGSLKRLLSLNRTCIHYLHSVRGKYFVEFDQIENLKVIHVGGFMLSFNNVYDEKFTECMLQNQSTLHTVGIEGATFYKLLLPELPVRSLQHLTSLSLSCVKMQHDILHDLMKFVSDNVRIENITLSEMACGSHRRYDSKCTSTLNLQHHNKLTSLCLRKVNILCNDVNTYSLKSIALHPFHVRIVNCYIDIFKCIRGSQLEHLYIHGSHIYMLACNTMEALTRAVNTLPCIKSLTLVSMDLGDDVLLQLHPDVTHVKIKLVAVTMSRHCFHCFIGSVVNNNSVIKVELRECNLTSVDGKTPKVMSLNDSVDYMSEYLTFIPTVKITDKPVTQLYFETKRCQ